MKKYYNKFIFNPESMAKTINWSGTAKDTRTIAKIAERAVKMAKQFNAKCNLLDCIMDIKACHLNGTPLKLDELLVADDPNFSHDVFGIRSHLDRTTGKLTDCFLPRYALIA